MGVRGASTSGRGRRSGHARVVRGRWPPREGDRASGSLKTRHELFPLAVRPNFSRKYDQSIAKRNIQSWLSLSRHLLFSCSFPELDGSVPASASESLPIGGKGNGKDNVPVSFESGKLLAGRYVPELDGSVLTPASE